MHRRVHLNKHTIQTKLTDKSQNSLDQWIITIFKYTGCHTFKQTDNLLILDTEQRLLPLV